MVAVPADITLEQLAGVMERHQHSRYPVFEGSSDNIIGIISAKNLAAALALGTGGERFELRRHMSMSLFVPETMRADRLLAEMKLNRSHLAVVVDDHLQQITEVVRGADLLRSTARQLLVYRALGVTPPGWCHVPLVRDAEGKRLAKRDQALSLRELRVQGFTPEQVLETANAKL